MRGYTQADWGEYVSDIQNASDNPLYKSVKLEWSKPTIWRKKDHLPNFDRSSEAFVYALVWNHGNSKARDHIEYLGLTASPKTRFGNHKTAKKIVAKRGEVKFSYAQIDFIHGRNRITRMRKALEEIEHLLIWAMWAIGNELQNEKKQFTLPGMGKNGGNAWQITNNGYRFSGRMPREIVFPWMLLKPGRDRSRKPIKSVTAEMVPAG